MDDDGSREEGGDFTEVDKPQWYRRRTVVIIRCHEQLSKGFNEENPIFEYEEKDEVDNLEDGSLN